MPPHFVQSPQWGKFKTEYGTPVIRVGEVQYTIHKIPFSSYFYAFCPKVDPLKINWSELKESLEENNCIAINFDVPNVLKGSEEETVALGLFKQNSCQESPRNQFAKHTIFLDITKSENELLTKMHKKHRYNLNYAQKSGVKVKKLESSDKEGFEIFYKLLKDTAVRQKYYIHPRRYYEKIWEILGPQGMCHILTAEYKSIPLASWMFLTYGGVIYYPYGGSSEEYKNLFASTLITWESIKLGKQLNCHTLDMFGAAQDPNDKSDPWHGFTLFKMRFGGRHVEYMDSYDFVVNKPMYQLFNNAQSIRWKILNLLK